MKSLITAVASMTVLLMFMLQFVANEKTFIRTFAANSIIEEYIIEWKEAGEVEEQSERKFIGEVEETLGGKVIIDGIDRSDEKAGNYHINIKVKDVIGPEKLLKESIKNEAVFIRKVHIEPKAQDEEAPIEENDDAEKEKSESGDK